MRRPASTSENRAHGAEKIGPRRYSDFFDEIGPKRTCNDQTNVNVGPSRSILPGEAVWELIRGESGSVIRAHVKAVAPAATASAIWAMSAMRRASSAAYGLA